MSNYNYSIEKIKLLKYKLLIIQLVICILADIKTTVNVNKESPNINNLQHIIEDYPELCRMQPPLKPRLRQFINSVQKHISPPFSLILQL